MEITTENRGKKVKSADLNDADFVDFFKYFT